SNVDYGGEIVDDRGAHRRHTTTNMGSGHYPRAGFGKAAFQRMLGYFPAADAPAWAGVSGLTADRTDAKCYDLSDVVERDPTSRPADPKHGEEIYRGTPRALAERLDREGVRRVYLDGGKLIQSFLREGLVSELTISVIPIILGSGIPLFAPGLPELKLKLVGS